MARADDRGVDLAGKQGGEVAALHPARKRLEVVHRNDLVLI